MQQLLPAARGCLPCLLRHHPSLLLGLHSAKRMFMQPSTTFINPRVHIFQPWNRTLAAAFAAAAAAATAAAS